MFYFGDQFYKNFDGVSLTSDEIKNFGILAIVATTGIFGLSAFLLKEPKRYSWVIGLMNATVLSSLSVIYTFLFFDKIVASIFDHTFAVQFYHSVDNITFLAAVWFGVGNALDLILGLIFYPKYVGLLTGFVHHTIYTWMMFLVATGNGFFTHCRPFGTLFFICAIEEVPTGVLALGSIFPSLRSDLGFGASFFLTRLLFHGIMMVYSYVIGIDVHVLVLYGLTFVLHSFWFSTWIKKYSSPGKVKKDSSMKIA